MAMYMDNSQIVEKMRNAGIIEENGWLSRYVLVEKWPMPVQKEETISTKKEKKVNQSKAKNLDLPSCSITTTDLPSCSMDINRMQHKQIEEIIKAGEPDSFARE